MTRRHGTLAPCFASRSQLSAEQRRIASIRSAPPCVYKNADPGRPLVWLGGHDDSGARYWSERHWTDANGARRSTRDFVRGEHAAADWLRLRDGEPSDY